MMTPDTSPHGFLGWLAGGVASVALVAGAIKVALITGFKDWVIQAFWDKVFKKRAVNRQKEIERAATNGELKALESTVIANQQNAMARLTELGNVTQAAADNMLRVADKVESKLEKLDETNGQQLAEMHEKVNKNNIEVAKLTQKVEDLPDILIGKLMVRLQQPPKTGTGG